MARNRGHAEPAAGDSWCPHVLDSHQFGSDVTCLHGYRTQLHLLGGLVLHFPLLAKVTLNTSVGVTRW